MKASTTKPGRQGDVIFIPAKGKAFQKPTGKTSPVVSNVAGRHVAAYGEVTGHHHSVDASSGTLVLDEVGRMYMTIDQLTEVEHQEHGAGPLPAGLFEIRRQTEWSDDNEPRPVQD